MSTTDDLDLAGAYAGERIFLIGNGPSLAKTPLDALEDEYTMAMNRIDLIYDAVDWRPDFYICMRDNPIIQGPLRNSLDTHVNLENVEVFTNELQNEYISSNRNVNYFRNDNILYPDCGPNDLSLAEILDVNIEWLEQFWSYDPRQIVYVFHTMYIAAQLAVWMGFEKIFILGADLGYGTNTYMIANVNIDPAEYGGNVIGYLARSWQEASLSSAILNGFAFKIMSTFMNLKLSSRFRKIYSSHFDDSYTNDLIPFSNNLEMRKAHIIIKRICESNGIKVYNATYGGELDVYPRENLTEVLRHR